MFNFPNNRKIIIIQKLQYKRLLKNLIKFIKVFWSKKMMLIFLVLILGIFSQEILTDGEYEYYEDGLDARGKVRVLNF